MSTPRYSAEEGYPTEEVLLADVSWVRELARSLVHDAVMADDVAQEVWLAALRQTQAPRSTLRAWLTGVARNTGLKAYRAEGRRKVHERAAAKPERTPSVAEVVEELSTQLAVAQAVNGLDEPYRETIHLRYYEDLSLKQIAVRMDTPLATVAARVQRGLKALQVALENKFGRDGQDWVKALLPLFDLNGRQGIPGAPLGWVAIGTKVAIGLFVAFAGVFGVQSLLLERSEAPTTTANSRVLPDLTSAPQEHPKNPAKSSERLALANGRTPANVGEVSTRPTGSLQVQISYADGTPASHVPVELRRKNGVDLFKGSRRLRSDRGGVLAVEQLAPGEWLLIPCLGGATTVSVHASRATQASLRLPAGPALTGVVVDAWGDPVAGAGIWLSASRPQQFTPDRLVQTAIADSFVTHTDGAGTFLLPSIGQALTIGARAAGHGPTPAYSLHGRAGQVTQQRLTFAGPGGSLSGTVLDSHGARLPGALIFVDVGSTEKTLPDGRNYTSSLPLVQTRSDSQGRFQIIGVRPGARRILVRAAGLAPVRRVAQVQADIDTSLEVQLERGMLLVGTVKDAQGAALENVLVWAARRRWSEAPDMRYSAGTRTDANGRYQISGLEPGHFWLTIDGGEEGHATTLLVGEGQQEINHEVTLSPGLSLVGFVLSAAGQGVGGLKVLVRKRGDWRSLHAFTAEDGAFTIHSVQDLEYRLSIEEGGTVLRRDVHVRPGPDPIVVSIDNNRRPNARLSARTLDAQGRPAAVTGVHLQEEATGKVLKLKVNIQQDGSFTTDPFPSGTWQVAIAAQGHPRFLLEKHHSLNPGEHLDLGTIRLQPVGMLRLQITSPMQGELYDLGVNVTDARGQLLHEYRIADARPHLPLSLPVSTGTITVRAWAAGLAPSMRNILVSAESTGSIEIGLQPGIPCVLRLRSTPGLQAPSRLRLSLFSEPDQTLFEQTLQRSGSQSEFPFTTTVDLAPGTYTIRAHALGYEAVSTLTVPRDAEHLAHDLLLEPVPTQPR